MLRYNIEHYRVVSYAKGGDLEGLKLQHPFYEREVPIILGDHVTTEAGTGAVHTAPGHGQEDYVVGQRYHLPVDNPVGGDGKFLADTPLFAGEHVFKANDHVIEVLKSQGALLHVAALRHSYPHCWRHKTPIIFRATPQWFIRMDAMYPGTVGNECQDIRMDAMPSDASGEGLRAQALAEINNVAWMPDWGQARIEGMVANRPDWCVSRQRSWGVPMALFIHKESQKLHPDTAVLIEKVALRIEAQGIDGWFDLAPAELLGSDADEYVKVNDTLDVWFDSGVTHVGVLERRSELAFPADLYLEGSDQHRGWFQSSLLASVAIHGRAPYRAVLTHGFTVDAKGMKMSKSTGNVVAPQKVVNALGADILRLWVASTDYSSEMSVSDEILKRTADAYRRIRNTARFLMANLSGFDPATDAVPPEQMMALDRWIVARAAELQQELRAAYERYEFHLIYQKVHNFCSVELSSFYLDVVKDRQYTTRADSRARRSTQTAMYHIVEAMTRWIAPILSFTAEEIWSYLPGQREVSVLLASWYELPAVAHQDQRFDNAFWEQLLTVRMAVSRELEKLRVAGAIGSSLDAELDLYVAEPLYSALTRLEDELRFVLITSYARLHHTTTTPVEGEEVILPDQSKIWIKASASTHIKCVRCWHHREDVGVAAAHPELCGRCVDNVAGSGEERRFA